MTVKKDDFWSEDNAVWSGWWTRFENIWDTYKGVFTWETFIKDTQYWKQKVFVFDKCSKLECEVKDGKIVWTKSSEELWLVNVAIKMTNTMMISKMGRVERWAVAWIAYVADYDSWKWNPAKTLQVFWWKDLDQEWLEANPSKDTGDISIEDLPF